MENRRNQNIVLSWEAPEHEPFELGPKSRIVVTVGLILIIGYALITNSPLMAITFILIGVVGYLLQNHEPHILTYSLTESGVIAGKNFYRYNSIHSFHLYDEPHFQDILSLHVNGALFSHVHIAIPTDEFTLIRQTLRKYVPEEPHDPSLVDTLEKFLHI